MSNALGVWTPLSNAVPAFDPFYYTPLAGICPVVQPLLHVDNLCGRCGPGTNRSSCDHCCSTDGYHISNPDYSFCVAGYSNACDATRWPPGFNTSATPRPKFGNVPYGEFFRSCTVEGTLALTYDDGPSKWTADLLDILKANGVKATFFIKAANLYRDLVTHHSDRLPAVMRRMYNEGHQIAGHTWSHMDLSRRLNSRQRRIEMLKNEMALNDILGFIPTYMRAPYNSCTKETGCWDDMDELGYHICSNDVDGRDWAGNYTWAEEVFLEKIRGKNVQGIRAWMDLAHDTQELTVHRLTQFKIDKAKEHGYKLVTAGECLNDPEENWYRDPLTGGPVRNLPPKGSL
ncbi:hypothetical protein HBI56_148090 [Parastagonospora nodorum]|uniref:NodB homology domain-containing protein n=1 Tax=Phaeosphaeria nodorum (strain SN15 / ATCC MYA-4574 / FGSC 10173) TaxID=321614 RepID=A0A7U2IBU1_PHANO|nr:hypothetical protein HBH56_076760 [Parastagonospora nodorum]QRD06906.1 hypothetical protein JI435_126830 [Parastagonospora nodorum SN15]KAH3923453.1 hypothetical protein HBH54_211190 [Parastagonospora nodorum]KAH3951844.1 hypothetical protein HBH53_051360 [Parastagonospora nodorum]KAH3981529.1 hypothetical protein HBH51_043710 [Parastagonospora nodorum]